MAKLKSVIVLILFCSLVFVSGCVENTDVDDSNTENAPSESVKASGGEELLDVRAEYSFCYDTGSYDPTQRNECKLSLTYKECREWMSKEEGTGNTFFYANFTGGEPTQVARTANRYYMVVKYAEGKVEETDSSAVFKDIPSEFSHLVRGNCYPNATIEIYNMDDELMGSMSFDYSSE